MSFRESDTAMRDKLKYNIINGAEGSALFRTYRGKENMTDNLQLSELFWNNDKQMTAQDVWNSILTNLNTILLVVIIILLWRRMH